MISTPDRTAAFSSGSPCWSIDERMFIGEGERSGRAEEGRKGEERGEEEAREKRGVCNNCQSLSDTVLNEH
jgi:hypothetical protein